MFAATILVIIPSIIVYIALQEQVVSGLSAGAVKAKKLFGEISQKGMRRFALEIKSFRGRRSLAFWF